jgi:hypothetical protein
MINCFPGLWIRRDDFAIRANPNPIIWSSTNPILNTVNTLPPNTGFVNGFRTFGLVFWGRARAVIDCGYAFIIDAMSKPKAGPCQLANIEETRSFGE